MNIEIRSDSVELSGYVNAVERRSALLPKEKGRDAPGAFHEIIKAGAFADSLKRLPSVGFKFNHEKSLTDSIELKEDNIGLYVRATVSDPDVLTAAKAGKLRGWSFGMENAVAEYKKSGDGNYDREIKKLDLLEVSILTHRPAYPATSVEIRDNRQIEIRSAAMLSAEELAEINKFSVKELTEDEVYTFSVVLCDNDIDRDIEKFSVSALEKLAELYVGKTGIFDHNPSAQNQSARIYHTEIVRDESRTLEDGEPYTQLVAKAYMMKTASNADLIAEIDGGIKKEVSISCSVGSKKCSICGAERHEATCEHNKGQVYEGKRCYIVLDEPTDAYEWSFVAVPAQKAAGVTKTFSEAEKEEKTKSILAGIAREIEIMKMKGRKNYESESTH